ncbi:MAG: YfiR family protein [Bryobacterales bacterium]|nr:YfiR family protein [Bryobacterales bacterium]
MSRSASKPAFHTGKSSAIFALGAVAFLLMPAVGNSEMPVSERQLKAALILRLIDFVDWPPGAISRAGFSLCVVGDEPLASALQQAAAALPGSSARLQISHHPSSKGLEACRLIVFGQYDERQIRSFLGDSTRTPVLTVGETDDFLKDGGIVRLRVERGRVRIELGLAAASTAGLRISSRLARLANQTDERKGVKGP